MKKNIFVFLVSLLALVSCQTWTIEISQNNIGEVGDQEIWISEKKEGCQFNGCKKTYTINYGSEIPDLYVVVSQSIAKNADFYVSLLEEENKWFDFYFGSLDHPTVSKKHIVPLFSANNNKVTWEGEKIFTWKVVVRNSNSKEIIRESIMSVSIIGIPIK